MNELGRPFRKNSDPKTRKNSKNQRDIAACEQKTTIEHFFQTLFSHSTLELEQKNFKSLLQFDLKTMKRCKQILKK